MLKFWLCLSINSNAIVRSPGLRSLSEEQTQDIIMLILQVGLNHPRNNHSSFLQIGCIHGVNVQIMREELEKAKNVEILVIIVKASVKIRIFLTVIVDITILLSVQQATHINALIYHPHLHFIVTVITLTI